MVKKEKERRIRGGLLNRVGRDYCGAVARD
jgi:hypothetical protein